MSLCYGSPRKLIKPSKETTEFKASEFPTSISSSYFLFPLWHSLSKKGPSLLTGANITSQLVCVYSLILPSHHFFILSVHFILCSYCNFSLSLCIRSFHLTIFLCTIPLFPSFSPSYSKGRLHHPYILTTNLPLNFLQSEFSTDHSTKAVLLKVANEHSN